MAIIPHSRLLFCFSILVTAAVFSGCVELINASGPTHSSEEIEYFLEIALGSEYGNNPELIVKWKEDIRVRVQGNPTAEDLEFLNRTIFDINAIAGSQKLKLVETSPNMEIYFVPVSDFWLYETRYISRNFGFFSVKYDGTGSIYSGKVLIASDRTTQEMRFHLIREEVTQSLGLMQDSYRYEDSIFYQEYSNTTSYSDMDRTIIEMLFLDEIQPVMTGVEIELALNRAPEDA